MNPLLSPPAVLLSRACEPPYAPPTPPPNLDAQNCAAFCSPLQLRSSPLWLCTPLFTPPPPVALLLPCYALPPSALLCTMLCALLPLWIASSCSFFPQPCCGFAIFAIPCSSPLPWPQLLHTCGSSLLSPYCLAPLSYSSVLPPPPSAVPRCAPPTWLRTPSLSLQLLLWGPYCPTPERGAISWEETCHIQGLPQVRCLWKGRWSSPNPSPLPHGQRFRCLPASFSLCATGPMHISYF